MIAVNSSSVAAYAYDAEKKQLSIKFKSGPHIYHYQGVPQADVDAMLAAPSMGSHIAAHIRTKFNHVKETPKEAHAA